MTDAHNDNPSLKAEDKPGDAQRKPTYKDLGVVGVMAVWCAAMPPLLSIPLFLYMKAISAWLRSHQDLGWWIFVLAFMVLAGLAMLPTYAQSALAGYAFGVTWGIPAALLGFAGGAAIGYAIARSLAKDKVQRFIENNPKWCAVRDALLGKSTLRTLGMVTLLRMPPNSPFALTNLVMASVKVPFWMFVVGTVVGMAPRTIVAVLIGSYVEGELTSESLDQAAPRWVWYVAIGMTLLIAILVARIAQRAIERVIEQEVKAKERAATDTRNAQ
jgi:uncharacterized membrane protein YdjX (TVP38/TMEM64 family)